MNNLSIFLLIYFTIAFLCFVFFYINLSVSYKENNYLFEKDRKTDILVFILYSVFWPISILAIILEKLF